MQNANTSYAVKLLEDYENIFKNFTDPRTNTDTYLIDKCKEFKSIVDEITKIQNALKPRFFNSLVGYISQNKNATLTSTSDKQGEQNSMIDRFFLNQNSVVKFLITCYSICNYHDEQNTNNKYFEIIGNLKYFKTTNIASKELLGIMKAYNWLLDKRDRLALPKFMVEVSQQGGFKKTSTKVQFGNMTRIVYLGHRNVKYIKMNKKYIKLTDYSRGLRAK